MENLYVLYLVCLFAVLTVFGIIGYRIGSKEED